MATISCIGTIGARPTPPDSRASGRFSGIRLACAPEEINVGEVVRRTEEGFDLVDCGSCIIAPACGFTGALQQALAAFMAVLDGYTLADLTANKAYMAKLFIQEQPARQISPATSGD